MAKIIRYRFLACEVNHGTEEQPNVEQIFRDKEIICDTEEQYVANLSIVENEAYNGEYTTEDDGQTEPVAEPTQLDIIEAQVAYTAMMTDTLLEV